CRPRRNGGGRRWDVKAELGTEYGRQVASQALVTALEPRRCLRELRHPVHAVVIGDGDGAQAEPGCLADQVTRVGRAVEEAERRVAVQFGPRDRLAVQFGPRDRPRVPRKPGNREGPRGILALALAFGTRFLALQTRALALALAFAGRGFADVPPRQAPFEF